jgi:hypothetical protein
MGMEERGREEKEGRRNEMTWPQTKFLVSPLIVSAQTQCQPQCQYI